MALANIAAFKNIRQERSTQAFLIGYTVLAVKNCCLRHTEKASSLGESTGSIKELLVCSQNMDNP